MQLLVFSIGRFWKATIIEQIVCGAPIHSDLLSIDCVAGSISSLLVKIYQTDRLL